VVSLCQIKVPLIYIIVFRTCTIFRIGVHVSTENDDLWLFVLVCLKVIVFNIELLVTNACGLRLPFSVILCLSGIPERTDFNLCNFSEKK